MRRTGLEKKGGFTGCTGVHSPAEMALAAVAAYIASRRACIVEANAPDGEVCRATQPVLSPPLSVPAYLNPLTLDLHRNSGTRQSTGIAMSHVILHSIPGSFTFSSSRRQKWRYYLARCSGAQCRPSCTGTGPGTDISGCSFYSPGVSLLLLLSPRKPVEDSSCSRLCRVRPV